MVLLEHETRTFGKSIFAQRDNIGEFHHSHEYIDSQFDMSEGVTVDEKKEDLALSRFLMLQRGWRQQYIQNIRSNFPPKEIKHETGVGFLKICM